MLTTGILNIIKRWFYWIEGEFIILKFQLRSSGLMFGRGVILKIRDKSCIALGENIYVGSYSFIGQGNIKSEILSRIHIKSNTYIGEFSNIRSFDGSIYIGENCLIAQHVSMIASNHDTTHSKLNISDQGIDSTKIDIVINDNVWVGANCVILPGSRIGKGCVIGAGSVVRGVLNDFGIYAGTPAKLIKLRTK
jgi:acetyltransferase-like isoleucine patch superfamily enzyme